MSRRPNADPRPPVGPWVSEFREHLRRTGVAAHPDLADAIEAHVIWYVSALLTDPRLDARARAAVHAAFLSSGVATLRGHGGETASRGRGSPPAVAAIAATEEVPDAKREEDE